MCAMSKPRRALADFSQEQRRPNRLTAFSGTELVNVVGNKQKHSLCILILVSQVQQYIVLMSFTQSEQVLMSKA